MKLPKLPTQLFFIGYFEISSEWELESFIAIKILDKLRRNIKIKI
jgi:hypothetical protein